MILKYYSGYKIECVLLYLRASRAEIYLGWDLTTGLGARRELTLGIFNISNWITENKEFKVEEIACAKV